jgi:hypothetical protein
MRDETICHRRFWEAVVLAACIPVVGAHGGTRVLHFPLDQYMGRLYVEDPCLGSEYAELGRDLSLPYGLDPKRVAVGGDWDFVSLAQGDVAVPVGRNIKLLTMLRLPADGGRPGTHEYKIFRVDRRRADPEDLSGLSQLDPNDLWGLTISRVMAKGAAGERVFEPVSRLTGLQVLGLQGTGITDKGMECLRPLRSLRALEFCDEPFVGNQGLVVLKDLPSLEYLDLYTGVTDAGLKHVAQVKSLRWLRLRTGRIWGPGLAELAGLPRLERLCIWGDEQQFSDRHIQYLEGLTHLKSLTLWGVADGLTDASCASFSRIKSLEELHFIITSPKFTPAGVAHLKDLRKFREIDFGHAWSGPQGTSYGDEVARCLAEMPGLESIRGMAYLSADGVKALASLPNLKCLDIALKDHHQGYDGPTGLSHLSKAKMLEEIRLSGGRSLSDADVAELEPAVNLRKLFIGFSDMTDRGMISIGKLRRLERLSLSTYNATAMTKRGLNELKGLTNLRTLDMSVLSKQPTGRPVIDEIPLALSALTKLKTLALSGVALQDADLVSLKDMSELEWLTLNGSFTENGLWHMRNLNSLKLLRIDNVSCPSGKGLASLAELRSLHDLGFNGPITDAALDTLAGFPSLWSLTVRTDEPVRPETIDHLWKRLPTVEYIHVDPLTWANPQRPTALSRQPQAVRPSPAPGTRRRR